MIECDGGSFRLARAGGNSVLLHNNGFVLIGGCGEEVEDGQTMQLSPGADDKVFRLDSQPVAACRAEEQKAVPIPAGPRCANVSRKTSSSASGATMTPPIWPAIQSRW